MGVLIGSAVIPITLSLFWRRLTGPAMTAGATVGAALGLISWLIVSSLQPAGLADFFISTGMHVPAFWLKNQNLNVSLISSLGNDVSCIDVVQLNVPDRDEKWCCCKNTPRYFTLSRTTYMYTPCPEKRATLFSTVTLAILSRFLYFLHQWKQEWILHNHI